MGSGILEKQNYTAKENMTYDKVKLKEQMEKLECVKKRIRQHQKMLM